MRGSLVPLSPPALENSRVCSGVPGEPDHAMHAFGLMANDFSITQPPPHQPLVMISLGDVSLADGQSSGRVLHEISEPGGMHSQH